MGLPYLYSLPCWKHAQYSREELSQTIHQSCAMSVLDHLDIVYVVRIPTYELLRASPTLGSRLPANAVSMGRILLAGLSDSGLDRYLKEAPLHCLINSTIIDRDSLREQILVAREKGFAWVDGELDESICGLAIAVKNMESKVWRAINVSLPSETINEVSESADSEATSPERGRPFQRCARGHRHGQLN